MSATAIVRTLLLQRTSIAYLVDPSKIRVGEVPLRTGLPAINITDLSANEIPTVSRQSLNTTIRARVQVTVYASTYQQQEELLLVCKMGVGVHNGTLGNYTVDSVLPLDVGPAILPGDSGIYERSRDFMVTFKEAN